MYRSRTVFEQKIPVQRLYKVRYQLGHCLATGEASPKQVRILLVSSNLLLLSSLLLTAKSRRFCLWERNMLSKFVDSTISLKSLSLYGIKIFHLNEKNNKSSLHWSGICRRPYHVCDSK
ncbi:conserved hypothetical protein [Sphingobacterium multivorum]|uniref:Uncharacterized protein n=1 Tax=Sphingobacterium multivorum TaxID=28454 RepID=A0A653XQX8_SPHMU|nr:conserved hypothetical protein [Sphingobacterium multivorum]